MPTMDGSVTIGTEPFTSDNSKAPDGVKLNIKFIKRTFRLLGVIFPRIASITVLLLTFLILVSILKEIVVYQVGMIPSKYYTVLPRKDLQGFFTVTLQALGIIISTAMLKTSVEYISNVLYVRMRRSLMNCLHESYFHNNAHYFVNVFSQIDNPDQRITQDVERLCRQVADMLPTIVITPFTVAFYTYFTAESTRDWTSPVIAYGFFIIFCIINRILMAWVGTQVYAQEAAEGSLRFQFAYVRTDTEAICLADNTWNANKVKRSLYHLLGVQLNLANRKFWLGFSISMANYLGAILSYLVLALAIFSSRFDDKKPEEITPLISQLSFYLMYLINQFTNVLQMADDFAIVAGLTHRISEMMEVTGSCRPYRNPAAMILSLSPPKIQEEATNILRGSVTLNHENNISDRILELVNLSYGIPNDNFLLVKDLNLVLYRGERLLVQGPSGCGKSSLLRVLSGLWPLSGGRAILHLQVQNQSMDSLLPGRPIVDVVNNFHSPLVEPSEMALTSMRSPCQFLGPIWCPPGACLWEIFTGTEWNEENDRLTAQTTLWPLIQWLGLTSLCVRMGGLWHTLGGDRQDASKGQGSWSQILSPGEKQRISLVRMFYRRPEIVFLDEATSQLPEEVEKTVYERLIEMQVTIISVAHRNSVRKFHTRLLEFHISQSHSYDSDMIGPTTYQLSSLHDESLSFGEGSSQSG